MLPFKFIAPIVALGFLTNLPIGSCQQTYTCPGLAQNPVVVTEGTSSAFTREINKSVDNTLCLLFRVTPKNSDVDMTNTITRKSNNDDYNIIPVARSYNNRNWEKVAGPYAQDLTITGCCTIRIPNLHLNDDQDDGKLLLLSFSHEITTQEEVSRFFHQTTFGPTLGMINAWNYASSSDANGMQIEMANWLLDQMNASVTNPTYHRAYFRERIDFSMYQENIVANTQSNNIRPRHPCEKYARWRPFSFTMDDYVSESELTVSNWNGQKLLSVDGIPRTVVSAFQDRDGANIRTGTYEICNAMEEVVDGWFGVIDPVTRDCIWSYNPIVNVPNGVLTSDIRQISGFTKSNFGSIEKILIQNQQEEYFGEAFYLKNTVSTTSCNAVSPNGDYSNILGSMSNGEQAWYAGHIVLDENSLENPVDDAGSAMTSILDALGAPPNNDARLELCPVASKSFVNVDYCYLSTTTDACSSTFLKQNDGDAVVVCGSPGEAANDPLTRNTFTHFRSNFINAEWESQKKNVWSMIALESNDQLRQRMAWALSQILVVTPNQIDEEGYSEIYLNYYDIFVRNAFGNYFDVLKEVSYSPMMAEMLSFLDSKSSAYVLEDSGAKAYPDENFAREIMQLFSIGIYELNMDGTQKLDDTGSPILTYDNTDIQNFARAWTGFTQQPRRSNIEMQWWDKKNRMDPMKIQGVYRDPFPKTDLYGGFIGDKVPLCIDLPKQHFLKKGATWRLLGSSLTPEVHEYPTWWDEDGMPDNVFILSSSSSLKSLLSSKETIITLDENLACVGDECNVDTMRLVKVGNNPSIYYEYIRPPCVELSFYENGKKISTRYSGDDVRKSMCANPDLEGAYDACCENPSSSSPVATMLCYYDLERTTYSTARERCQTTFPSSGDTCDHHWTRTTDTCTTGDFWVSDNWYWTNQDCAVKVKVEDSGNVAIVHEPTLLDHSSISYSIDLRVNPDNTNYFGVHWTSEFPNSSNSCGDGACVSVYKGCYCNINVVESSVFNSLPTESQVIDSLQIGAVDPNILDTYTSAAGSATVQVWHKNGGYDKDTIFGVTYRGREVFLRNMESIVQVEGTQYSFRNPPSFINIAQREPSDAMHESDAVIENYFFHENLAPFLAYRIIQRFGVSNPSPRYIESVATAFKDGTYSHPDSSQDNFGDGRYGNLESMVAAVVLDPEARNTVVDSDPTSGSLIEPMLKITRFMRALEFNKRDEAGDRLKLVDLQSKIGQEAHSTPNVFSFFQPEYAAPGHIKAASLTSPEAQVMSGPKLISILNGFISMVNLGLTECYSGFGERTTWACQGLESYFDTSNDQYSRGSLQFSPSNPSDASSVVDELVMLLTAGRLNDASRDLIINAYQSASSTSVGLDTVQKLIASTPEFHSTNVVDVTSNERPEMEAPIPTGNRYKAIVFLMLDGGIDSYNVLIPHSGCSGGDMSYEHYNNTRGAISVPQSDLHQIDASSSSQVCDTFGIHPNLPHIKSLYDDEDLLWVGNMGVLQEAVTKDDWQDKTDKTALFAHNVQTDEVHKMDIFDDEAGRGVGGRMLDVLQKNGVNTGTVSVNGIADALVSAMGSLFVLDPRVGFERLNPMPWAEPIVDEIKQLNNATNLASGLMGETWSNLLFQAIGENDLLFEALRSVTLTTEFPTDYLGKQMELVSKLIKSKETRGNDRDIFYVEIGGFDTHDNIKERLDEKTIEINAGLEAFTNEMKAQGSWDDVTVVMVSEFARTLAGNTGAGSDHAWAGNYFIAGGEVDGKRILGTFPETFSNEGPLAFEPGILIPTHSWDTLWNGVAQWFGVSDPADLNEILPNRNKFTDDLFTASDLYSTFTSPPPTPSTVITPAPSSSSTSTTPPCSDSPNRFRTVKETDGSVIWRDCTWVANKSTNMRCSWEGVSSICPVTCDSCDPCRDSTSRFRLEYNGKKIARDCTWVGNKATIQRCKSSGVKESCRETCGVC